MLFVSLSPWFRDTPWHGKGVDVHVSLGLWRYLRRTAREERLPEITHHLLLSIEALKREHPDAVQMSASLMFGGHEERVTIYYLDDPFAVAITLTEVDPR